MAISQNRLTGLLVVAAVITVVVVLYASFKQGARAAPLKEVPKLATAVKSPDADSPAESLRTLTAEVKELKTASQQLSDEAARIKNDNNTLRNNETAIVERVRAALVNDATKGAVNPPAAGTTGNPARPPDNPSAVADGMLKNGVGSAQTSRGGFAADIPSGLGFDGTAIAPPGANFVPSPSQTNSTAPQTVPGAPEAPRRGYIKLVPIGMTEAKGASGQTTLIKTNPGLPNTMPESVNSMLATGEPASGSNVTGLPYAMVDGDASSRKKPVKPYFTIPENATLTGGTAMTAIVGRVPVDGRVQDPMQFKLLIGRDNLAANGQQVPADVAGIVVSGTAIGDMTLLCNEGLIQSLTFVFNDGTIQTVSRRRDGAAPVMSGGASSGATAQGGIASSSKLGYISDEHGNPCITGRFVTNAPSYLTNMVGLKTLSLAASAMAQAQTSTVATGSGIASGVTGNKSSFVLGQAAGGAVDEVNTWVMRRLNNSFDAVVTAAGARVVVHIDQEIKLDKDPAARKLDYGHLNAGTSAEHQGNRHGLD